MAQRARVLAALLCLCVCTVQAQFHSVTFGPGDPGLCIDGGSETFMFTVTATDLGYPAAYPNPIVINAWEVETTFVKKTSFISSGGGGPTDYCVVGSMMLDTCADSSPPIPQPGLTLDRKFDEVEIEMSLPGVATPFKIVPGSCFSNGADPFVVDGNVTFVVSSDPSLINDICTNPAGAALPNFPTHHEANPSAFDGGIAPPQAGSGTGTYTVEIKDLVAQDPLCFESITISMRSEIFVEVASLIEPTCFLGQITFNTIGDDGTVRIVSAPPGVSISGLRVDDVAPGVDQEFLFVDDSGNEGSILVTVPEPDLLRLADPDAPHTDALCPTTTWDGPSATGTITVHALDGTPPYSIQSVTDTLGPVTATLGSFPADPMATQEATVSGLEPGTYRVTVEDASGCTVTTFPVTIDQPPFFALMVTATTPVSCFGASDGAVSVSVSGGTGTLAIDSLTSGSGPLPDLTGIEASVDLVVVDDNGCLSDPFTIVVGGPLEISVSYSVDANPSCIGNSDGVVTLAASGGSSVYNLLSIEQGGMDASGGIDSSGFPTLSGFNDDPYEITLEDSSVPGCIGSVTVDLTDPDPVFAMLSVMTPLACRDGETAILTAAPSGGSGSGYTLQSFSGGSGSPSISGLSIINAGVGSYTVVPVDGNGCVGSSSSPASVSNPSALAGTVNDVSCPGSGALEVTMAMGGTGSTYGIRLDPPDGITSGVKATGLMFTPASYDVYLSNEFGCENLIQTGFELSEPSTITGSSTVAQESCPGDMDGSVEYDISGGTSPYSVTASTAPTSSDGITFTWSGLSTATITSIQAEDSRGCVQALADLSITALTSLSATATGAGPTCPESTDGTATVSMSGGNGATFSLATVANGGTVDSATTLGSLPEGTTAFTFTDGAGCVGTGSVSLTASNTLSGTAAFAMPADEIQCFGGTGTLTVTANLGDASNAPFMIGGESSGPGSAEVRVPGVSNGMFTGTLEDVNGCEASVTTGVTQPTAVSATVDMGSSNLEVTCAGDSDGEIALMFAGGVGGFTVTSPASLTGLSAGTYVVTFQDSNMCSDTISVDITDPSPPVPTLTISGCNGNGNAVIEVSFASAFTITGVEDSSSAMVGSVSGTTVSGLNWGETYTVFIMTTADGCPGQNSITMNPEPALLTISASNPAPATCPGEASATFDVAITGGTNPGTPTVHLSSDDSLVSSSYSAPTLSGLPAEVSLYAIVTDDNGCLASSGPITLTDPEDFSVVVTPTAGSCGLNNGGASFSITGGTPGYSFVSADPFGMGDASAVTGLAVDPSSTTIFFQDSALCAFSAMFTVPDAGVITINVIDTVDVLCEGTATGIIRYTVSGGVPFSSNPPYTSSGTYNSAMDVFVWSGRNAGDHTITAEDSLGCMETATVTVTEFTADITTSNRVEIACIGDSNGAVTFTAEQSEAPSGSWTLVSFSGPGSPSVTVPSGVNPATFTASGLAQGTYTLTLEDHNGCEETETVSFTDPTPVTATFAVNADPTCRGDSDGEILATPSGGRGGTYTYAVSPAASVSGDTISGLSSQQYTVTVSDVLGCESAPLMPSTLTDPELITFTVDDITCPGATTGSGRVRVSAVSGGNNNFQPGNISPGTVVAESSNVFVVSGLQFGDTLRVEDTNGCFAEQTLALSAAGVIDATVTNEVAPQCNGGTDGTYDITSVSGGYGAPFTVIPGSGSASPSGGSSGPWIVSGLSAGSAMFSVTDSESCTSGSFSATIPVRPALSVSGSESTSISCPTLTDGSAELTVSGGSAPYSIMPSAGSSSGSSPIFTVSGLGQGALDVTVTDGNSCVQTFTSVVTLSDPTPVTASIDDTTPVLCNGGSEGTAMVSVSGGTVGLFTGTSSDVTVSGGPATMFTLSVISAGTWSATFADNRGCSAIVSDTFTDPPALSASATTVTPTCVGLSDGTAVITVSGGESPADYTVTPPMGISVSRLSSNQWSASGIAAGTHAFGLSDSNSCVGAFDLIMNDPPALSASVTNVNDPLCKGDSNADADLEFSGGVDGVFTIDTIVDSMGTEFYPSDPSTATRVDNTRWTIQGFPNGTYTVSYSDGNGCTATEDVDFVEPDSVTLALEDFSCHDNARILLTVTGGAGPGTYAVVDVVVEATGVSADPFPTITDPTPSTFLISELAFDTEYRVSATDGNGCASALIPPLETTAPTQAVISAVTNEVEPTCNGDSDGSADFSFSGGTGPTYTITSIAPMSAGTISPPNALVDLVGDVSITISFEDSRGCPGEDYAYQLSQPDVYAASVINTVDPSCPESADGSITLEHTGGTPPYSVVSASLRTPSNIDTDVYIDGLDGDPYSFTTQDANMCTVTHNVDLDAPPKGVANFRDISCRSPTNGRVEITFSGTFGNERITDASVSSITDGPPVWILEGIGSAWYAETADACGPLDLISGTVSLPPDDGAIVPTTITEPTCATTNDGEVRLAVTGGTFPYVLQSITPSNGQMIRGTSGDPMTDTPLPSGSFSSTVNVGATQAGMFTAEIVDANGCIMYLDFTVDGPPRISIQNVIELQQPTCSGAEDGQYELVMAPSSRGPFTVISLPYASLSWEYFDLMPPEFRENTDPMMPPPPSWTNVLNGVREGTTVITMQDNFGCVNDVEFESEALDTFGMDVTLKKVVRCRGEANGEITIDVPPTRQLMYTLTPGVVETLTELPLDERPFVFDAVQGGVTYTMYVEDLNGCSSSVDFMLEDPPTIAVSLTVYTPITCEGANDAVLRLELGGGGGLYMTPTLDPPDAPFVSQNAGDPVIYPGGDEFEAGPWHASGLAPGPYTVAIEDVLLCESSGAITVVEPRLVIQTPDSFTTWRMYRPATILWAFRPGQDPLDHRMLTVTVVDMADNPVRTLTTTVSTAIGAWQIVPHHFFSNTYKIRLQYAGCQAYFSDPFRIEGLEPGSVEAI